MYIKIYKAGVSCQVSQSLGAAGLPSLSQTKVQEGIGVELYVVRT